MKPERRYFQTFLGDTLEYRESQQIEPAILEDMVARLREGDSSLIHPIIKGHYKLVTALVAENCRSRRRAADIEGAAFLALVEAVHNSCPHIDRLGVFQESRLYDNNITYYITTTVNYAIKDEYANDHIMRMPSRTIRDKISKGEKFEDIVPGEGFALGGNDHASSDAFDCSYDDNPNGSSTKGSVLPFVIPIAKPEFPSLEFSEALAKCIESETERAIIKLRSEGYGYEEIGKKVGLSTPRIGQIVPLIEKRFDRLYP